MAKSSASFVSCSTVLWPAIHHCRALLKCPRICSPQSKKFRSSSIARPSEWSKSRAAVDGVVNSADRLRKSVAHFHSNIFSRARGQCRGRRHRDHARDRGHVLYEQLPNFENECAGVGKNAEVVKSVPGVDTLQIVAHHDGAGRDGSGHR